MASDERKPPVKKSRFSEEQMVKILREADRVPVPEVAKRHGISDQTVYAWRKRFGELDPADVSLPRFPGHLGSHGSAVGSTGSLGIGVLG